MRLHKDGYYRKTLFQEIIPIENRINSYSDDFDFDGIDAKGSLYEQIVNRQMQKRNDLSVSRILGISLESLKKIREKIFEIRLIDGNYIKITLTNGSKFSSNQAIYNKNTYNFVKKYFGLK